MSILKGIIGSNKIGFGRKNAESYVGIDIGLSSVKVVQLRKEDEKAVLETYGQLKSASFFKTSDASSSFSGFLGYMDEDAVLAIKDVLQESNVTAKMAIMSVPAHASFVTLAEMPQIPASELATVLPLEARRYVPVPSGEVFTNWTIIKNEDGMGKMKVLFVAVPREIIAKYQRIAKAVGITLAAIEVESFGMVRALLSGDMTPTLILYFGFESTTAIIVDEGILRVNHTVGRGQEFVANALARSLNISKERAEELKNEIGFSEKMEQKEISGVLEQIMEVIFREVDKVTAAYNRENLRRVEKVILTGGGARMKGLMEYTARILGLEVNIGNAFKRITYPQFMQPILREVSPHFAVSIGLALREMEQS